MDLIANILVSVLTIVAGLLTNVLAHDICASADHVCTIIIRRAAHRLAPFDQGPVELEWLGDLSERETVYEKYHHAIGCYVAAGGMRRRAMTVMIDLKFSIRGVGTVPLTIKVGPPLLVSTIFAAVGPKAPRWFRRTTIVTFLLYTLAKLLLSAHRLGRGSLRRFANEFKQYKEWGYEAHIERKGLDLDLSKIFRVMVLEPKRIPQIAKAFKDAFAKKG